MLTLLPVMASCAHNNSCNVQISTLDSKLYHGGHDSDQIVDEQPALPAELVSDPAPYEAAAHPTDGEDGDRDGVHEGRGLIGHVLPVIAESVRLSNKLLYHLQTSGIFTKF